MLRETRGRRERRKARNISLAIGELSEQCCLVLNNTVIHYLHNRQRSHCINEFHSSPWWHSPGSFLTSSLRSRRSCRDTSFLRQVSSSDMTCTLCRIWGQPSIYFPIGDHVNVSCCCSHTNASGVISTSHIVASHITKLLLSFRQILQFRF